MYYARVSLSERAISLFFLSFVQNVIRSKVIKLSIQQLML